MGVGAEGEGWGKGDWLSWLCEGETLANLGLASQAHNYSGHLVNTAATPSPDPDPSLSIYRGCRSLRSHLSRLIFSLILCFSLRKSKLVAFLKVS